MVGNDGETFYLQTDLDAGRARLVAVDVRAPDPEAWRDILPEREDILEWSVLVGDELFSLYMRDAVHRIERFSLDGDHLGDIALPTLGSVGALNARRDDGEFFFGLTSFLHPGSNFRYDVKTGETEELPAPHIDFPTADYETTQVFVTSKDGTRVPMFLVHRKGIEADGRNPTLLYGYGGFSIPLTPGFSISRLAWLERGGVAAIANLRGGGEYGKAWHEAGTLGAKQNVFDDFIACAEHLVAENITSPDRLAIQGGSNGGLLVGAAMIQRPDLFAAALPAVGVMDMLRFHKFTIGWAWVSDYGSADDPEQFEALYAYSPLHNLKEGTAYPATLVTTSDHDDRVVPAHSFKFAAALQHAHDGRDAGADQNSDQGRARRGQADRHDHRGAGRHLGVSGAGSWNGKDGVGDAGAGANRIITGRRGGSGGLSRRACLRRVLREGGGAHGAGRESARRGDGRAGRRH